MGGSRRLAAGQDFRTTKIMPCPSCTTVQIASTMALAQVGTRMYLLDGQELCKESLSQERLGFCAAGYLTGWVLPRGPVRVMSDNQLHYLVSYAVAFAAFGLTGRWYLWPYLRDRAPRTALTPLLLYASFRVNGLMFLMPGLVSSQLPKVFAKPTAYGDLTAALLALLALWPLRAEKTAAIPMVWLFNIVGLLDLVYASISTLKDHVDPTYLGVSYYLAAINVPAMVVTHVLIFAYLLRHARARTVGLKVTSCLPGQR